MTNTARRIFAFTAVTVLVLLTAPVASAGLLIVDTQVIGYAPNAYSVEASNLVDYSFANSKPAPNTFAIFQTHDPFGAAIVKTAITNNGHTFTVFTPAQLLTTPLSSYRVVILNWDDHFTSDFITPYTAALPALEDYVNGGGVLWVQSAIQGSTGTTYGLPFGGTVTWQFSTTNVVVDPTNPVVQGLSSPFAGNLASHAILSGFPANGHVVIRANDTNGPVTAYVLSTSLVISTGTGAGGGPHVRFFDFGTITGAVTPIGGGFFAYDPGFTGGVNISVVQAQGSLFIVTGVGPGGGPHVRIFKLTGGVLTPLGGGFFAYDPSFAGGVRVAATVDAAGTVYITTGAGAGGGPHVKVFMVTNLTTGTVAEIGGGFLAYDPSFPGGVFVGAE